MGGDLDGTRADKIVNGQLHRPPPMDVIVRDYPDIVIGLIAGRCSIDIFSGPNDHKNVIISFPRKKGSFTLFEEDFEACKRVAILFSQNKNGYGPISAFLSEPIQDLRNRIAAHLRVEFVGR